MIPDDDKLKHLIMGEAHDNPFGARDKRENWKTFILARNGASNTSICAKLREMSTQQTCHVKQGRKTKIITHSRAAMGKSEHGLNDLASCE